MKQKNYPIDKIFVSLSKFFKLKNTFKVTFQFLFNFLVVFNTVSFLNLFNFKLKKDQKCVVIKTWKKFDKPEGNFDKTSDNSGNS